MPEPIGRIRVIVVDSADLERSISFWTAMLGVEASDRMDEYAWTTEIAPGVRMTFQQVSDVKREKSRVHFDLASDDPDGLIAKAVELGGRVITEVDDPKYSLTVVADPDGNEFCVNRRQSSVLGDSSVSDIDPGA